MFISSLAKNFAKITVLTLVLLTIAIGPTAAQAQTIDLTTKVVVAPYTIAEVVNQTNAARNKNGFSALATSSELTLAAQAKADHMANNGYFGHWSPDSSTPWDFMTEADYQYYYAGENLAIHFMDTEQLVEGWLNSPAHRENLLSSNFTETGIGIAQGEIDGQTGWMVVQFFGSQI